MFFETDNKSDGNEPLINEAQNKRNRVVFNPSAEPRHRWRFIIGGIIVIVIQSDGDLIKEHALMG